MKPDRKILLSWCPLTKPQHIGGTALMSLLQKFANDESGATAIEYGLIAAGISVAIITVVSSLGSGLNTTLTSVQSALK
jgi:pilus assembly protein Flp/PilA